MLKIADSIINTVRE